MKEREREKKKKKSAKKNVIFSNIVTANKLGAFVCISVSSTYLKYCEKEKKEERDEIDGKINIRSRNYFLFVLFDILRCDDTANRKSNLLFNKKKSIKKTTQIQRQASQTTTIKDGKKGTNATY